MSAVLSQPTRNRVGNYVLLDKIGIGGMATVYKARHAETGDIVAIKIMSQRLAGDRNLCLRFARECKVARGLDHPHIVRVLDFGLDGSRAYLVMEYVDGESLGKRLEREGRIDEAEAIGLIGQIGTALDWAHRRGLVHRDIKPSNILISRAGEAKLNDLGLVKDPDSELDITCAADILGTPNFMAPEQFENAQNADARSDLYSLAAALYMIVTGTVPFGTGTLTAVMRRKLSDDIPAPRQLVAGLSPRLDAAILRAVRAEPGERQASVLEFLHALSGAASMPEAEPRTPSTGERRRARRYPVRRATSCRPLGRPRDKLWPGEIVDISESGLCLQLKRRFEPRTVLTLVFAGGSDEPHHILLRVLWTKKTSARIWRLGGEFDQALCSFELDDLRKSPQVSLSKR